MRIWADGFILLDVGCRRVERVWTGGVVTVLLGIKHLLQVSSLVLSPMCSFVPFFSIAPFLIYRAVHGSC